ncbi:TolC family protein [Cupriavidus basilensis]|uniref:TolC family protein n=1 Tax=Cupriavidus basilensis TaxID=68895 RepID=UPI0023E79480|nr:TolC family protein [Cupriavidus basilensis]MDF3888370.1 TolC family protein [Cupriavidus basilensis]
MQIKNNIHKNLQAAPALRNTLLATLALAASASWAQDAPATAAAAAAAAASAPVRFASYLDAVERHNIGLSAQQETIRSAEAEISIAGVRPDPVLKYSRGEIETSSAVSAKPPRTHEFEVEIPIELGGKRSARVRAANSNLRLTEANLQGFKHTLYQESAAAFVEACRSREALVRQESTLAALTNVVRANEIRRKAGDIGGLELSQSRVERDRFGVEVKSARAAAQAAMQKLSVQLGVRVAEAFGNAPLACNFHAYDPGTDSGALIARAMEARDEVRIARATLDNARDNAGVARANRWVDPSVGFTLTMTPGVRGSMNEEGEPAGDGTPRSRMVGVSVSIPLPLSRLQRGELIQAESAVTQAMLGLREAELKTEVDVRNAFTTFQAARENLQRYRDSVIADADRVLEGMRQSYRHGSASLLELLDAQRTADETYLDYLQAQADLAAATVELQRSTGLRPAL